MAKKITDLTLLTTADATDIVPIVDISASTTKKTTVAGLAAAVASSVSDGGQSTQTLTNPYKFSVYRSTAFTAGNNIFAKVQFDTEVFDTGSNYDNATNYRFTAPIAGFYHFSTSITSGGVNNGAIIGVSLYKNGSEFKRLQMIDEVFRASGTATPTVGGSATLQLAQNDYIEVWYQGNGTAGTTGATFTWFSGHFVSTT